MRPPVHLRSFVLAILALASVAAAPIAPVAVAADDDPAAADPRCQGPHVTRRLHADPTWSAFDGPGVDFEIALELRNPCASPIQVLAGSQLTYRTDLPERVGRVPQAPECRTRVVELSGTLEPSAITPVEVRVTGCVVPEESSATRVEITGGSIVTRYGATPVPPVATTIPRASIPSPAGRDALQPGSEPAQRDGGTDDRDEVRDPTRRAIPRDE